MKDEVKVFDALKAREVLKRVHNYLGILIRENLVKDAPFLKEGELENESDLADDVWEVLQGVPRNCDRPECATSKAAQDVWRKEDGGKTAYYEWLYSRDGSEEMSRALASAEEGR